MTIPLEILVLLSPKGFEERFHYHSRREKTYVKAYEEAEKDYESYFGKRRYASYDSFRTIMQRKYKK
jgi:hypothetical protein|tara:strand:- start:2685 stop:2885 length:201 start_codon:yes stop_codon:yes gene_type:complete